MTTIRPPPALSDGRRVLAVRMTSNAAERSEYRASRLALGWHQSLNRARVPCRRCRQVEGEVNPT